MSEDKLAQLLAMGASTALLQGGVDGRAEHQSHYPFEEHPALLQKNGTRTTSQLTAMLDFRKMNNIHDPTKEEKDLAEYIKNAKSFLWRGLPTAQAAIIDWNAYYEHAKLLTIQHVNKCLQSNRNTQDQMKVLLKHTAEANMAPTASEDNVAQATSHYAIPLVTDDPWAEGDNEVANIQKLAESSFTQAQLKTKEGKADVDQAVASITRSLKFLRTLLNHTFLLLLIQTSTNQSAKDLRRVFDEHAHAQTLLSAEHRKPFLAPDIIKHIKDHCLTDNLRKATSIESTFNKSIRPEGMPLLKWLQTFRHPLALHKKAKGASYTYTKEIERSLWKLHFAKQITGAEQTLILTHSRRSQ